MRVLRTHLGKELIAAAVLLLLAFVLNEKPPFIDELKNTLVLWLILALISGGLVFLWQFAMAPVRMKRELEGDRERILRESDEERQKILREAKEEREKILEQSTVALQQAAKIRREYGSSIVRTASQEAIKRQLGTELRDIRHKIEIVKSTQPTAQYSHGFRLPNARFDEYRERLAEDSELYAVIERAYTAAHHVNEVLAMRETRAGPGVQIGVTPDEELDAAYEAAGEALDEIREPRGDPTDPGQRVYAKYAKVLRARSRTS